MTGCLVEPQPNYAPLRPGLPLTSASIFLKNRSSAASACLLARTIDREVVRGLKAAGPDVSASLRGVGGMGGGCE